MQGNTGNSGGTVFASGRKWALGASKDIGTLPVPANNRTRTGKRTCKTVGQEEYYEKPPKRSTLVVGQKPYGKCQLEKNLEFEKLPTIAFFVTCTVDLPEL
jgi:hypothetical protein